jgi:hypothetical protein
LRGVPDHRLTTALLLAACALAGGCSREVSRQQVREFVDLADEAARKRYAPEICELRGRQFTMQLVFHAEDSEEPAEMEIGRKLYCQQAGSFSQLRQYRLERKSLDISLAPDRRTAKVRAEYVETRPFYAPHRNAATLDDFEDFEVIESVDESVVGIEDGDIVFLSTQAEAWQTLVPKSSLDIPYD